MYGEYTIRAVAESGNREVRPGQEMLVVVGAVVAKGALRWEFEGAQCGNRCQAFIFAVGGQLEAAGRDDSGVSTCTSTGKVQ